MTGELWVVGDVHGCFEETRSLLRSKGLIDDSDLWSGGQSRLWFIGDLTDRGPHGIEAIDLVMRLSLEARQVGGEVGCLIGNHEIFLLGARRFGETPLDFGDGTFHDLWAMNGGRRRDLEGLTPDHLAWMTALPSLHSVGPYLLMHADTDAYVRYGSTIEAVNSHVQGVFAGDDIAAWGDLIHTFIRRNELWDDTLPGEAALAEVLNTFGAEKVVHGHTPIPLIVGQDASGVTEPLVYSGGRCTNVDGGMFLGGPGVAVRLDVAGQ